jgi:hypothetical protein
MPAEGAKQIKEVKGLLYTTEYESASKETGSQKWTSAQRES